MEITWNYLHSICTYNLTIKTKDGQTHYGKIISCQSNPINRDEIISVTGGFKETVFRLEVKDIVEIEVMKE